MTTELSPKRRAFAREFVLDRNGTVLIGELEQAGEINYREADHMAREWVAGYAAKRGLLASLWQHDSAKAVLPRELRATLTRLCMMRTGGFVAFPTSHTVKCGKWA